MKLWAFIVTTALAAFVPAIAQAADTDSLTQTLGEITVTAIKLGNDKTTPASITTLSQRDVQRNNITDMKHAAPLMPNFFLPDYGSRMTSTIYVRG
ncbi:MAG: TonB-dependent receptor, partial [Muribaculaceae bacterium]|nr:TonB-dependent receptor [Muribaculaceae bacterium]